MYYIIPVMLRIYINSTRPFRKPFLRERIRTIIYWKTRAKFETGQLVTLLICDTDTKPALLGSLLMKGFGDGRLFNIGVKKICKKKVEYTVLSWKL